MSFEQIKYVWTSKWSIVKTLYFIVRYYAVINLMCVPRTSYYFTSFKYAMLNRPVVTSISTCLWNFPRFSNALTVYTRVNMSHDITVRRNFSFFRYTWHFTGVCLPMQSSQLSSRSKYLDADTITCGLSCSSKSWLHLSGLLFWLPHRAGPSICILILDTILALRLWALYNRRKLCMFYRGTVSDKLIRMPSLQYSLYWVSWYSVSRFKIIRTSLQLLY